MYDRYSCIKLSAFDNPEMAGSSPLKRSLVMNKNGSRMLNGLNLSPRKPAKSKLLTEIKNQDEVRKS